MTQLTITRADSPEVELQVIEQACHKIIRGIGCRFCHARSVLYALRHHANCVCAAEPIAAAMEEILASEPRRRTRCRFCRIVRDSGEACPTHGLCAAHREGQ